FVIGLLLAIPFLSHASLSTSKDTFLTTSLPLFPAQAGANGMCREYQCYISRLLHQASLQSRLDGLLNVSAQLLGVAALAFLL
ncbi:MAG: hypothetical protein M3362_25850, partial [Acidobacteriota bacterium]|nr:hypothetical protein [Acidobacteriota bacterium]